MFKAYSCQSKKDPQMVVMPDSYTVFTVEPEWILGPEEMGSKTKFWYRYMGEEEADWLFKHPKQGTGEHWAEKIAERFAIEIRISCAPVELAEFRGSQGSATKSFAFGGSALHHGNEVLKQVISDYDPKKTFHQSAHTLDNIFRAMDNIFISPEFARRAKIRISEYLVLDALIGNTDRHHENWGILRERVGDGWQGFVAPSFDHASSLGRELLDKDRDRFLVEERVGKYVEKGHGGVYWSEDERRGPSPLELVRRAAQRHPDFFQPALKKLSRLDESTAKDLVARVPDSWMTASAREFAIALIHYNFKQLKELIR